MTIRALLFDYGGVLAEEGFRAGLCAIANSHAIDPESFFLRARELVYSTGYVTGQSREGEYWKALRYETGVRGSDPELRAEILNRFVLRNDMIELVRGLRGMGKTLAILSDQTNWLDELDERDHFFRHFDFVFNSYHLHKSKRDPTVFDDVCRSLGVSPGEVLFTDDSQDNVRLAQSQGLIAIQFLGTDQFREELQPIIEGAGRNGEDR